MLYPGKFYYYSYHSLSRSSHRQKTRTLALVPASDAASGRVLEHFFLFTSLDLYFSVGKIKNKFLPFLPPPKRFVKVLSVVKFTLEVNLIKPFIFTMKTCGIWSPEKRRGLPGITRLVSDRARIRALGSSISSAGPAMFPLP